jgi:hypothetical protein
MCTNNYCPLSVSCRRFNSKPSENQSYQRFEPSWEDEVLDEVECSFYLEPKDKIKEG